jgi:hypothetical protein
MVQEFVDMGPNVFTLDPTSLTENQKDQLREFAETVESVYNEYGYFPDPFMVKSASGNLRFDKNGQLMLIDTNFLQFSEAGSFNNPRVIVDKLKKLYENGDKSIHE